MELSIDSILNTENGIMSPTDSIDVHVFKYIINNAKVELIYTPIQIHSGSRVVVKIQHVSKVLEPLLHLE